MKRRLAAVLAADVAGYTKRMEQDSAGTVAAWQSAREEVIEPTVTKYSGRIVKFTGDGFLAEFPTVYDAVSCAISMQESLASNALDFRMGVNHGDIFDDGKDIHGEGVNVAARIEALCKTGGICISGSAHEQVRHQIKYRFKDRGRVRVKNVSEPVRVVELLPDEAAPGRSGQWRPTRPWLSVAAVLLIAITAGALWWQPWALGSKQTSSKTPPAEKATQPFSDKPSIAVLPFVNLSNDKEQEYFSDGMTEDLITDLSKISNLTVISRTSTSGYKGKKFDVRDVGKALGARYVVEGSVRKAGQKVRINTQLIDANTGGHIWAERYDGELNEIFRLQDRVLEKIVGSLALTLSQQERRRLAAKGTDSVTAHDLYLKGLFEESKFSRQANAEAVRLYEQALSIDPDYALPYARLSNILQYNTRSGWSNDIQGDLQKAVELAEKAVVLDELNPNLHWILSRAISRIHEPGMLQKGIKSMERAIELDPDFADAYAFLGLLYTGDGRPEDGLRSVETAMRMNPRHPFWYLFVRGACRFFAQDYEKAIDDLENAVERSPTAQFLRWFLAAIYVKAGRQDDAEWQVEELKSLGFKGDIRTITETQPIQHPSYLESYKAALRDAGIPE